MCHISIRRAHPVAQSMRLDRLLFSHTTYASIKEAKRCIARIQADVMKKQAETLDSKEGRQNSFRIAKQKKKERKDITGTNCLKGDNGELLVSEEQVSGRWREYFL